MAQQAQWMVQGIVGAPVEQVWEVMVDQTPGLTAMDKQAILHGKGGDPYLASMGKALEGKISLDVHPRQHQIGMQGEWWYRGVHTVEAHPRGSLITYEVFNIAPKASRWMAQLVQAPSHARTMPDQLRGLLTTIGTRLHVKTELIDHTAR